MKNVEATGRIKIIKIPAGEAPLEIRKAWVGLVLPCHPYVGFPEGGMDRGVSTGKKASRNGRGFSVPQDQAINILQKTQPIAADWWKRNGFPAPAPDDLFGFKEDEAQIVSGVTHQRLEIWNDQDGDPRK